MTGHTAKPAPESAPLVPTLQQQLDDALKELSKFKRLLAQALAQRDRNERTPDTQSHG